MDEMQKFLRELLRFAEWTAEDERGRWYRLQLVGSPVGVLVKVRRTEDDLIVVVDSYTYNA